MKETLVVLMNSGNSAKILELCIGSAVLAAIVHLF
jgi:hypothetical protein